MSVGPQSRAEPSLVTRVTPCGGSIDGRRGSLFLGLAVDERFCGVRTGEKAGQEGRGPTASSQRRVGVSSPCHT